jgi:Uma2 family endonuclease
MTLSTTKWTVEDYHRMIDVGLLNDRHVELLSGEIVEMSPEGEPHAHDSTEVRDYLIALLGDRVKVRDGKPITIPNSNSEPEPDIAIVQPLGREYRQHHPYPENIFWLIEFSDSSLTKDLESKSKLYAAANIPEYWVVNLQKLRLVVFRSPIDGAYASMQTWERGTLCPLAFPEVQLSIDRLLHP